MLNAFVQFELTRPIWLVGLLSLALVIYLHRRSLVTDLSRRQRLASVIIRCTILTLLILGLSGLTLVRPSRRQMVVFAIDRSLSVGDSAGQSAEQFITDAAQAAGRNETAVMRFALHPGPVQPQLANDDEAAVELDRTGTDLSAAVRLAAASISPSFIPHIVLLTDGNQTQGDVFETALSLGVRVSVMPVESRADPEVQVSAVQVPPQVRQGEPFYVQVVIDSNHDDQGWIEVYQGQHQVLRQKQKLVKGENRFRFRQVLNAERIGRFTVHAREFNDTLVGNNSHFGLVSAIGKPRVLMIEDNAKQARHLVWALKEEDIQVDVRPAAGLPDTLAQLQNYEMIMLSNVPATDLSLKQMEVVRSYVQDLGGGLIMLGGDQSFGLGGYYKSVLEQILPVRSDFEKEKENPSLAMMLVIDKSGSMGGMKVELAKDAARSVVELLGPRDQVGILAFDGSPHWVSEIRSATDKGYLLDRIGSIQAGGGTAMHPAMEQAYESLVSVSAKLKHVIILSDGISRPGDFVAVAQNMAGARMTVSTVAVGQGADQQLLEQIANVGGGRYYFTDDPMSVPQIFAKETIEASKSAINEQPFVPQVLRPTQALSEIDLEAAPFLLGYVVTRPKPTCELVLATESGDPLLAWWRYGLGMTVAFTSDAKTRWASEWIGWTGFSRFWSQVVRHVMRKSDTQGIDWHIQRNGTKTMVTIDAVDQTSRYVNDVDTQLTIVDPKLAKQTLSMRQTAPGRYVGRFETPDQGAYHLDLVQSQLGRTVGHQWRGLAVGYPDELRIKPVNEKLLRSIAEVTSGLYSPSIDQLFAPTPQRAQWPTPLWPYLFMAALSLFLIDVALRRIDLALLVQRSRPARSTIPAAQPAA